MIGLYYYGYIIIIIDIIILIVKIITGREIKIAERILRKPV
jgi:hypothetical protein